MEGSTTSVIRNLQPAAGDRTSSLPPTKHCVVFCVAFGLVFVVSGAVLLSSGLPYRRLQLRIISACMLASGVVLLAVAIVQIFSWRNRPQSGSVYLGCEDAAAAPPPAYEEVVLPPPSYDSVMMLDQPEKEAEGAGSSDGPHHPQGFGARLRCHMAVTCANDSLAISHGPPETAETKAE